MPRKETKHKLLETASRCSFSVTAFDGLFPPLLLFFFLLSLILFPLLFPLPDLLFFLPSSGPISFPLSLCFPLFSAAPARTWLTVCIWRADARRANMPLRKKKKKEKSQKLPFIFRQADTREFSTFFWSERCAAVYTPDSCVSISMQGADVSKDYSTLDVTPEPLGGNAPARFL